MPTPNQKNSLFFIGLLSVLLCSGGLMATKPMYHQVSYDLRFPKVSQTTEIEFSQSTFTNITVLQGQIFQVNWSIAGGFGKSYRVIQIGEYITSTINFGFINNDQFYVYGTVNSSQLGTFTVHLEVYNLSYSTSQEFTLFVKPNLDLILPQFFLIVAGSVAVSVVSTVTIIKVRGRGLTNIRRKPEETTFRHIPISRSSRDLNPEDLGFISTTVINLIAIGGLGTWDGIVSKSFREVEPGSQSNEEIFKYIKGKSSQIIECQNYVVKILDTASYLTCSKYPYRDQAIIIVSSQQLSEKFLSLLNSTIELLADRDPSLIDNAMDYLDELIRILWLNRSYGYIFPKSEKTSGIEGSRFWNARGNPVDEIQSLEMEEIEEDLEEMPQTSVDSMVNFLDRMEQEFEPDKTQEN